MSLAMAEDESVVTAQAIATNSQTEPLYNRLSMPDSLRIGYATFMAGFTGGILGVIQGARTEALRFRAENAHRLPTTTKGWYLYHKSKNYTVMWHGIKEGARMSGKLGSWVGLFFLSEMLIDNIWNRRKDFKSTMVTGVVTGLLWSRYYSITGIAKRRMVITGLKAGLAYGLLQDGVGLLNERIGKNPSIHEPQTTKSSKL